MTAIGFAIGNPIATEAIKGIGLNLASNLIQSGSTKLKESWFSSSNGILNHDIQQAFVRAFIKASKHLEREYFRVCQNISKEEALATEYLFSQFREQAFELFLSSKDSAISEEDLKICLYAEESSSQAVVWSRIESFFTTYSRQLKNFLEENLLKTVVFCFGEELKKETEEGKRAWRAFQRMLLEGIQKEVETINASQTLIRQDLKKLDFIGRNVKLMSYVLQYRLIEPLGEDVKFIRKNVEEIHEKVHKIHDLVEKINPPPFFDESTFREEYNEILRRVMIANTAFELNSIRPEIEYLEKKYPGQKDIFFLKNKFERAYTYEMNHPTLENPLATVHPSEQPTMETKIQTDYSSNRLLKIIGASLFLALLLIMLLVVIWWLIA